MPTLIRQHLDPARIDLSIQAQSDKDVILEVASLLEGTRAVRSFEGLCEDILTRERLSPTAIGNGVAVPHARTDHVDRIVMAVGRLDRPVIFDQEEVWLVFLIGIPRSLPGKYLSLVGALGRLANNQAILNELKEASSPKQFIAALPI